MSKGKAQKEHHWTHRSTDGIRESLGCVSECQATLLGDLCPRTRTGLVYLSNVGQHLVCLFSINLPFPLPLSLPLPLIFLLLPHLLLRFHLQLPLSFSLIQSFKLIQEIGVAYQNGKQEANTLLQRTELPFFKSRKYTYFISVMNNKVKREKNIC